MLAAGSVFAAIQLVLSTLFAMLAYSIAGSADAGATKALFDFDLGLDLVAGLAAGLFVLASSVGLKRTQSIPAWLAGRGGGRHGRVPSGDDVGARRVLVSLR